MRDQRSRTPSQPSLGGDRKVTSRIERLRERLQEIEVYIEGPEARHELANYVLDMGALTPADFARISKPQEHEQE